MLMSPKTLIIVLLFHSLKAGQVGIVLKDNPLRQIQTLANNYSLHS